MGRRLTAGLVVGLASALSVALLVPAASAEDLNTRRDHVKQQLAKTRSDLNESNKALTAAGIAVDRTQNRLDVARAQLAKTRRELAAAKARDVAMAAKLKQAQADLAAAKAAVRQGQAELDAQHATAGQMIRDQYQQQTNLLPLAALVNPNSTLDLQTRLQWSTTMFDTAQAELNELTAIQVKLDAAKARQTELEAQVADDRRAAAANLKTKQGLETRAASEAAAVAQLLAQKRAVERAAAADVAQDKKQYAQLTRERASVERRIAARIAAEKAAAHRAAVRRAAAQAAAARRAAAAARAHHSTPKHVSKPATRHRASTPRHSSGSSRLANAPHGFMYPVSAPITSPYGMRFHPILHYWKLHDGTDFGAGCGTAIRAAYGGRVAERYYNAGYGNRLMIDHGRVDGKYVTTGYNHAVRYIVRVGQHVKQGQVIGYVGETGYATGCHLHLMVWLNGRMVNPMTWF
jgi:murein DD-endopeptidase MepM/ murein hydrolase activator NlpD